LAGEAFDLAERKRQHRVVAGPVHVFGEALLERGAMEIPEIAWRHRGALGLRAHRDSSGHDLCWHHPQLWGLLPEPIAAEIAVPPWPKFLRGCLKYREALERELPNAPAHRAEYK
jgi:hypothetical protein